MWIRTVIFLLAFFIAMPSHAGPPPGSNANARALVATGTSVFSDYFMRPSESGVLGERNVIVWAQGGGPCYVARVFFKTDNMVRVDPPDSAEFFDPDQIFVWQMVCAIEGDDQVPGYVLEYIYALPDSGFEDTEVIQIREDGNGDGFWENNASFGYRFTFDSVPFGTTELVHSLETYEDMENGTHIIDNNWSRHLAPLGEPLTVNGMTFDDVAVVHFLGFDRVRFNARGIGPVREVNGLQNSDPFFDPEFDGQRSRSRDVIFYRIDGQEQGSLDGTPFGGVVKPWFLAIPGP